MVQDSIQHCYNNDDSAGHEVAGVGGAVIGSVLGPLGVIGGSVLGKNAVKS